LPQSTSQPLLEPPVPPLPPSHEPSVEQRLLPQQYGALVGQHEPSPQ